ncbi:hypothetical protein [Streptomyces nitrosporeus]|uniref:hypothetical protein n=1 Tax=Streptomyces nitrosporeus TaxID=28894 RepID=UPI00399F68CC
MRKFSLLLVSAALTGVVAAAPPAPAASAPQSLQAEANYAVASVLSREVTGLRVQINRTSDNAPVSGLFITFETGGERYELCTAYTDTNGVAECTTQIPIGVPLVAALTAGYDAVFTGTEQYAPISAHGGVGIQLI